MRHDLTAAPVRGRGARTRPGRPAADPAAAGPCPGVSSRWRSGRRSGRAARSHRAPGTVLRRTGLLLQILVAAAAGGRAGAAEISPADLRAAFSRDTTITLAESGVEIRSRGYEHRGGSVEAILLRPLGRDSLAAVLLIPGYSRTAVDYLPLGLALARRGFACLAVTQPGFGRSAGPPDFAGPRTVDAVLEGYERLLREPGVDPARTAIFGYSRGAMVASLLAVRLPRLRGVVLGGGVYDLAAAYREIRDEEIRRNIESEAGADSAALRARSSLFLVEDFPCPALILHGANDESAPVEQARRLHARLEELGKPSELVVFEGAGHGLPPAEILRATLPFLERTLAAGPARPHEDGR